MRDDLISRSVLLNKLKDCESDTEEEKEGNDLLRYIVRNEPTAYDLEDVIKQLKEKADYVE